MAASKEGMAERRLRPLWDAIDSRQYKSASKLVSALLAKYPSSAYLVALKGLILERTGKAEEALALCQQAKDSGPVDDLTLNTLQMVYQRLRRLDQITQCYEFATNKNPKNLEMLTCLFNCYVREYNYIKQQHVAMKLYKLFGDEKYLLWAVCSIQLQVHCGDDNGVQLLPLAEAMLKKRIQSHGLTDPESLLVYVTVLRQQQKFDAALDAISGKLGSLFTIPADKLLLHGELMMETKQYVRAAEVYTEILKLNPDDWDAFLHLLDATAEESGAYLTAQKTTIDSNGVNWVLRPEEFDLRLDKVEAFVEELVAKEVDYVKRGPFLAKLEIAKVRLLHKKLCGLSAAEEVLARERKLSDEFINYFERFGHMVSFASDVKGFVAHVGERDRERLCVALHSICSKMVDQNPSKLLRWRIAAFQVEELIFGTSWPDTKLLAQAVCIIDVYVKNLHLSGSVGPQESMHGEGLLVLAVNLLTELFRRTQDVGYLVEAILVLEFGLSLRKYNSQYKLLLINMYCLLSAGPSAVYWYKTLDIKYILLDTLSHHMVYYLLGTSLSSDLEPLLKDCIKFHQDHEVEAADLAIMAYRKGTYSKVLEFVQFKQKLQHSHHYSFVRIEDLMLSLKKESTPSGVDLLLAKVNFGYDTYRLIDRKGLVKLTFLEDMQMRPWWSPAPDICLLTGPARSNECTSWQCGHGKADRRMREERAKLGLRKRALLPRLLYLSLHALSSKQENVERDSDSGVVEFGRLVEEYSSFLEVPLENPDTWLGNMVEAKHLVDQTGVGVVDVLTLSVFASAHKLAVHNSQVQGFGKNGLDESFDHLMKAISSILDLVLGSITKSYTIPTAGDVFGMIPIVAPGSGISVLTSLTSEVLAWLGLCLQSWAKDMHPAAKKKKKVGSGLLGEEQVDQKAGCIVQVLQRTHSLLSNELERLSLWLSKYLERPEEDEVGHLLSLLKQGHVEDSVLVSETPAPGRAIQKLQSAVSQVDMLSNWRPQSIVKHIVNDQRTALDRVQDLVKKQLRSLKVLRL